MGSNPESGCSLREACVCVCVCVCVSGGGGSGCVSMRLYTRARSPLREHLGKSVNDVNRIQRNNIRIFIFLLVIYLLACQMSSAYVPPKLLCTVRIKIGRMYDTQVGSSSQLARHPTIGWLGYRRGI